MIAVLLASMLHAAPIIVLPPELSTADAQAQYDAKCKGAAAKTDPCKHLQWQLEYALWEDLQQVRSAGKPIDDDVLDVGAAADCPQLKAFSLESIRQRGNLKPNEKPLVVAALNDPYPLVREQAFDMTGQLEDEHWTRAMLRRGNSQSRPSDLFPVVDEQPTETALGVPLPPGASYQYFASDSKRAFFLSKDSADKVIAWYAAKGKKAIDGNELKKRQETAKQAMKTQQQDPMAMARKMQEAMAKGKDPQTVMADMQKEQMQQGAAFDLNWTHDWEGKEQEGVMQPRYVVIDETSVGTAKMPSKIALVFKDDVLGGTAIVIHRAEPIPDTAAMMDPKAQQRMMKMQQDMQNDPLARDAYDGRWGQE